MIQKAAYDIIEELEQYIAKQASLDEGRAINFVRLYLGDARLAQIARVQNPYADVPVNIERDLEHMVKIKDELVDKAKKYTGSNLVYGFFTNIRQLDIVLGAKSGLGDTLNKLIELYESEAEAITDIVYDGDFDYGYLDVDIENYFGPEYTIDFVTMLILIISHELDKHINGLDLKASIDRVYNEFKGRDFADNFYKSYGGLSGIGVNWLIEFIQHSVLFRVLDYRFLDKKQWPFNGTLKELMLKQLEKFNFTTIVHDKLRMVNCDTYKGVDLETAMLIMILKDTIVNMEYT